MKSLPINSFCMWRWIRKAYNSSKSISKEQNLEEALPVLEQMILSNDECVNPIPPRDKI